MARVSSAISEDKRELRSLATEAGSLHPQAAAASSSTAYRTWARTSPSIFFSPKAHHWCWAKRTPVNYVPTNMAFISGVSRWFTSGEPIFLYNPWIGNLLYMESYLPLVVFQREQLRCHHSQLSSLCETHHAHLREPLCQVLGSLSFLQSWVQEVLGLGAVRPRK